MEHHLMGSVQDSDNSEMGSRAGDSGAGQEHDEFCQILSHCFYGEQGHYGGAHIGFFARPHY
jgi:hypothetical protein